MHLFRKCHKGYNSAKYMTDDAIGRLGKYGDEEILFLHDDFQQ